jgi:hypothetical protein
MDNKPQRTVKDLASIESQSLETHVVVSHERHEEIQKRFDRVHIRMDKMEEHSDKQFTKIERIIIWSMGTLFITLLTTLFTIVYRAG